MSETCAQCRGTGAVKVVGLSETGFRQTVTAPCAACRPGADHPEPIVSNVARWDATSGPVAPPAERGAKPAEEQFGNLCDAMAETVANMTDEEVIEEARAEGLDPHAEAERLRTMVLGLVAPPPAPEPGEMSREEIVSFLSAVEDANIDADPRWLDNGTRAILAHDAALRARAERGRQRADDAETEAGKWRRELSAACELSERYREIVTTALNQPPEYWYDKHDNGEWSAEHAAHAIQALFESREGYATMLAGRDRMLEVKTRERDEARRLIAGVHPDDRSALAVNILRVWPRAEIETFARHLLGDSREQESLLLGQLQTQLEIVTRERDEAREQRDAAERQCRTEQAAVRAEKRRADEEHTLRLSMEGRLCMDKAHADLRSRLATAEAEAKRIRTMVGGTGALADDVHRSGVLLREYHEGRYAEVIGKLKAAEAEVARLTKENETLGKTVVASGDLLEKADADLTAAQDAHTRAVVGLTERARCYDPTHAALRQRCERLVEAGDEAGDLLRAVLQRRYTYSERQAHVEGWLANWAAARGKKGGA